MLKLWEVRFQLVSGAIFKSFVPAYSNGGAAGPRIRYSTYSATVASAVWRSIQRVNPLRTLSTLTRS